MKYRVFAVVLLSIPTFVAAQMQGTGAPGTIGPGGSVIPYPMIFINMQQQELMRRQMLMSRNRLSYMAQMQLASNELKLSELRGRGVEDGPALIAALHQPALPGTKASMLFETAAAFSAGQEPQQQSTKAANTDDSPSSTGALPPMMIRPTFGNPLVVEKPKFSVEPGLVKRGTKVVIKTETHYSTLYYTTNGWTPTTQSARYKGPITITTTTHLQVIAVGPNFLRSSVERADYDVGTPPPLVLESTVSVPKDGVMRAGTPVRVVFGGADIDSEKAELGDEITVLLDEDIKQGDIVFAPKGSKVNAVLTVADAAHGSAPGDLVFEIHSVEVGGKLVPLFGGETLEGVKGGKNVVIKQGMTAMAFVSVDTDVKP